MKLWQMALLGIAVHQSVVWLMDKSNRARGYDRARALADATGKPLLVVGGPVTAPGGNNSLFYAWTGQMAHGLGDTCVDIVPETCAGAARVVMADVRSLPFRDKEFGAAYCSHLLELLPNAVEARRGVDELYRVADHVVIEPRTKWLLGNWIAPNLNQWGWQREDDSVVIEPRRGATI